ncbi:MAG: peroxiredoxin [Gammaproteobacteria bacterium]|jgi:peroxiredoxin Q/BCP
MLASGDKAPSFELPDDEMHRYKLGQERGQHNVVLYFYPKDDTPGCTIEALDFTAMQDQFAALDTVILGISRDDCISHAAFRDKHGLTVRLLADTDGKVCQKYGVWQEKEKNGVKKMGIVRSTFIIDKQGVIREAMYSVGAKGHAAEVLEKIKALAGA